METTAILEPAFMPQKKSKKPQSKKPRPKKESSEAVTPMSAATRRRLVHEAAERSDANPVFEIRGVAVSLTPQHHDVLIAALAARSLIETKPPEIPASVSARQLADLVNSLAQSEARGVDADELKPPLPNTLASRKRS